MSPSIRPVRLAALLLALFVLVPRASAEDRKKITGHDLEVVVDWRWAGCHFGGYFPIRVQIENKGAARDLVLRFEPSERQDLPTVERTVRLERKESLRTTLAIPIVGNGISGSLGVYHDGAPLQALTWPMNLPGDEQGSGRPALLVVSDAGVDANHFEAGVDRMFGFQDQGMGFRRQGSSFATDHVVLDPDTLPDRWIDFSGLDVVAAPVPMLVEGRLDPKRVQALLDWVETGGTLIVHGLGELPDESIGLENALGLDDRALAEGNWDNLLPTYLNSSPQAVLFGGNFPRKDDWDNTVELLLALQDPDVDLEAVVGRIVGEDEPSERLVRKAAQINEQRPFWWQMHGRQWPARGVVPFVRRLGYGQVVAVTGDPFELGADDWAMLLAHLSISPSLAGNNPGTPFWSQRYGIAPRFGDDDFQMFLIPGVRSVPVISFLVLITLFAIVIGPLNYFLLARRKQLNMLVVTIPLLAALTSISLFGYSTVSHGFSTRSRVRSVTLLDERAGSRVSIARVAMFAGMAPSRGLAFETTTAIHPIWPQGHQFRGAHVDWTKSQAFDSGWLRPRTRTQFLLVENDASERRLDVRRVDGNALPVRSELGATAEYLMVRGDDGRWYVGRNVESGEDAVLVAMSDGDVVDLRELLRRHPLKPPEVSAFGGEGRRMRPRRDRDDLDLEQRTRYSANLAERVLTRLSSDLSNDVDVPRFDYVAVLADDPDVDIGLERTRAEIGYHVLVGFR